MSNIDFSQLVTAEAKAMIELGAARDAARTRLVAWIGAAADALTGTVPLDEKLSWTAKEAAARAMMAGNATPEQAALIAGEAAVTGEAAADLAAKVIGNADAYRAAIAGFTGLRRKAEGMIDAATTPEAAVAAVEAVIAEGEAVSPAAG